MTDPTYARIYTVIRRIPAGKVSTYGRIAEAAGASGPRQVGYALHAAGNAPELPWHRVVNAQGVVAVGGPSAITQRIRLEREGVRFNGRGKIDFEEFGWTPRRRRVTDGVKR